MTNPNARGDRLRRVTALNGGAAIRFRGRGRLTVGGAVEAVTDDLSAPGLTPADLQAFAAVVQDAIQAGVSDAVAAQRVQQQAPMFGSVGRLLNANPGLLALVALILSVVIPLWIEALNAAADAAPTSVDPAEVERIVEERMPELEEQPDLDVQPPG